MTTTPAEELVLNVHQYVRMARAHLEASGNGPLAGSGFQSFVPPISHSANHDLTRGLDAQAAVIAQLTAEADKAREERRALREAIHTLTFPDADPTILRAAASELDCGDCDFLGAPCPRSERGDCGFQAAEGLRDLATALELKDAEAKRVAAEAAENEPRF